MSIVRSLRGQSGETQSRYYGVVVGIVTNIDDPENQGRVQVRLPWLSDDSSHWARLAQIMTGNDMGSWFIPEVGDEVLLAFEHGDIDHPFVIGSLYNGQDQPPSESAHSSDNNNRMIKSRSGHIVRLDDTSGSGQIEILSSGGCKILLKENGDIEIDGTNVKITADQNLDLEAQNITIKAQMNLECEGGTGFKVKSNASGEINSSATLTIRGAVVNIN